MRRLQRDKLTKKNNLLLEINPNYALEILSKYNMLFLRQLLFFNKKL